MKKTLLGLYFITISHLVIAQLSPKPVSQINKISFGIINTVSPPIQFILYRFDSNINFRKISFRNTIISPGQQNRCYSYNIGIYNSNGALIRLYEGEKCVDEENIEGATTGYRVVIDLGSSVTLQKGDYYIAMVPKDLPDINCKMRDARVQISYYDCYDSTADNPAAMPACILRKSLNNYVLPESLPREIFYQFHDNNGEFSRVGNFKAYVLTFSDY